MPDKSQYIHGFPDGGSPTLRAVCGEIGVSINGDWSRVTCPDCHAKRRTETAREPGNTYYQTSMMPTPRRDH